MPPGAEGRTRAAPPFCYFTIRPGRSPDSTAGVDFWNSSCCCLFSTVFRWNFIDLCFSSTLLPETVDSRVKRTLIRTRDNVSNDRHGGTGWEKGVGSISIELLSRRYHAEVDRYRKYLMSNVMNDDWVSSISGISFLRSYQAIASLSTDCRFLWVLWAIKQTISLDIE